MTMEAMIALLNTLPPGSRIEIVYPDGRRMTAEYGPAERAARHSYSVQVDGREVAKAIPGSPPRELRSLY